MKLSISICILSISLISCSQNKKPQQREEEKKYELDLSQREKASAEKEYNDVGEIISTLTFEVKTKNPEFENGIIPWASIEKPQNDLKNLIARDDIVVSENDITIIIDYPLNNEYRFNLKSKNGFTRKDLLIEISKHYYKLYKEEEESATIKTLPMEKRTMYNRNETNGKYGIWGHDIADLVLTDIYVHKTINGKIILTLNINS